MGTLIAILLVVSAMSVSFFMLMKKSSSEIEKSETEKQPSQKKTCNPVYLARLAEVKRQAEARGDSSTVQSVLNMTYDGPLPTMKPDGTFTDLSSTIISYPTAGINFRRGLKDYVGDFIGYLEPESKNKYDHNAIAIHHSDGKHLGYIPADDTNDVRALNIPFPITIWGEIEEDFDYDENRRYYRGTIYIEVPKRNSIQNFTR